jgi:hypothetical protein
LGYNLIFASSDLFILSNWTENANELIKNFKDAGRR